MKKILTLVALAGFLTMGAQADVLYEVDPGAPWIGYMDVFDTPANGGAYVFGSAWGTADLTATFDTTTLTLGPNTIVEFGPFWYTPTGAPGAVGNKIMDATMYVEVGSLPGQLVTFSGTVLSDTLTLANNPGNVDVSGNGWTSVVFIKDFAPDYSSFAMTSVPVSPGAFSISLNTINDPARHVQYGFETAGPDVWVTDVAPYGTVVIETMPEPASISEPASIALIGLAGGGLMFLRRRMKILVMEQGS